MSGSDPLLRRLALRVGVAPSWRKSGGEDSPVSVETLRALLNALGFPADNDGAVRNTLGALDAGAYAEPADFATARVGQPVVLPRGGEAGATVEITFEDGERRVVRATAAGRGALTLPPLDRPGYHRLQLSSGELTLATAPVRCPSLPDLNGGQNGWGVVAQIYALGAGVECGVGDFGGVAELAASLGRRGADLLVTSPTHAQLGVPERFDSPYSPSSRQFLDSIFADLALALPGPLAAQAAAGSERAHRREFVDWRRARPAKLALLKAAYERLPGDPAASAKFAAFKASAPEALRHHALFEAIRAERPFPWDWRDWPTPYRSAKAEGAQNFANERADAVSLQIFLQWVSGRSLAAAQATARRAGMSVGLIADVAAGLDPAGSEAWRHQGEMLQGITLGAPPDLFTTAGQDWRLTTFSPGGLSASGYAPFIATLRACLRDVGGLRIDHMMGMQRRWLIPEGFGPKAGAYVSLPGETLFRLIALEADRARALVIGEDLGVLPPGFHDEMAAQGVTGMRLLRIERGANGWNPPSQWDRNAAALTSTHDVMSTAGWWSGADIRDGGKDDNRERDRGLLWKAFRHASVAVGDPPPPEDAAKAVDAAVAFLSSTPCEVKLVTMEDVLAAEIQVNVPGTTTEQPNWRHRYTQTAEAMLSQPPVEARLKRISDRR